MKRTVIFLLALAAVATAQSSILNVSHDLTTLNIASQNMTRNSSSLDSRPLLEAAVAYAQTNAIAVVTADPGAYYFLTGHAKNGRYLDFVNLQDLTLDLAGSDLYFQSGSWASLLCTNCQNVQFLNFTMDALQLPFTQVQVASVDTRNNRINYTTLPGWEPATNFNAARNPLESVSAEPLYAFDFRNGAPLRTTSRMSVQRPIDPGYLPIVSDGSPWSNTAQLSSIKPGDVIALTARAGGATLTITGGSNNTVKNVAVYYGSQVGVMAEASPDMLLEQVQVIPRPGTDRLMSSNAGGIGAVQLGQNLTVRRCRLRRTGDDGISPNSQELASVTGQTGTRTVQVNRRGYNNFVNGLQVQLIDNKTGFAAATVHIVSQNPPYSTATPVFGSAVTLTFDQDLPTLATGDAMVYADPALRGAGLLIENNLVEEGLFTRGISLWGLLGGTIQGNVIRNVPWSAINVLEKAAPDDWMTGPVANLTIQRNAIEQFTGGFGSAAVTVAWAAVDIEATDAKDNPVTGSPFQNITVQNNFVSTGVYSGLRIGNVNGATITGNLLMNVSTNPTANNPSPSLVPALQQPLAVTASANVNSTPNTIDALTAPVYVTSGASYSNEAIAPGSWAAVFGTNLAPQPGLAVSSLPLPTSGGVTVTIVDSAGVSTNAPILFVSPQQIGFLVPPGCAIGAAVVTVASGGTVTGRGATLIDTLAPALFSSDGSGTGTALGMQVLTHVDGSQVVAALTQPVDLGLPGDVATVVLYATGLRNVKSIDQVAVYLGGLRLTGQSTGSEDTYFGLDQISVIIPSQLQGSGSNTIIVSVNGLFSNSVAVNIK